MADFNNPKNTNPLLSLFGYVRDGFTSLAKMFDGTTDSNVPVGAKKIDGSTKVVSQWNGSAWVSIGSVAGLTAVDANSITVSNLETDNFKSGVIVTTVGATGSDTAIPSEQAVREAIATTGTFAPTFSNFNGTVDLLTADWARCGNLVNLTIKVRLSSLGTSGSNPVRFNGITPAISTTFQTLGLCTIYDATNTFFARVYSAGTIDAITSNNLTLLTYGDLDNFSNISYINITYIAA